MAPPSTVAEQAQALLERGGSYLVDTACGPSPALVASQHRAAHQHQHQQMMLVGAVSAGEAEAAEVEAALALGNEPGAAAAAAAAAAVAAAEGEAEEEEEAVLPGPVAAHNNLPTPRRTCSTRRRSGSSARRTSRPTWTVRIDARRTLAPGSTAGGLDSNRGLRAAAAALGTQWARLARPARRRRRRGAKSAGGKSSVGGSGGMGSTATTRIDDLPPTESLRPPQVEVVAEPPWPPPSAARR